MDERASLGFVMDHSTRIHVSSKHRYRYSPGKRLSVFRSDSVLFLRRAASRDTFRPACAQGSIWTIGVKGRLRCRLYVYVFGFEYVCV